MKTSLRSRRMFLQGVVGAALAVPFLPSLVPSRALAQAGSGPNNLAIVYTKYGNEFTKSSWTHSWTRTATPSSTTRWPLT